MSSCMGSNCAGLFGLCGTGDTGPVLAAEWKAKAEQLCLERGLTLSALGQLTPADQAEALAEAGGLSPLQRAQVLAAVAAGRGRGSWL